ncbi:MAG: site-specific DNA-methyltransferase [Deltaproteobacteria bacterium]|nr:site-specific DNA-methyltransferase [Deltaproteobacteria bacterium]
MLSAYRERVKCIYIDPPYNTGKDFVYSDRWDDNKEDYWEHIGFTDNSVKVDTNMESSGRYHSNWMNMLYPRLLLARQLLKDDGVAFISMDDNEIVNLRKLCNEVFGEANFVAQLTCLCNPKGRAQDKHFATNHEYVMVYSKNSLPKGSFNVDKGQAQVNAEYTEEDEDGKFRTLELRNTHREFGRHNRRNLYYPFLYRS